VAQLTLEHNTAFSTSAPAFTWDEAKPAGTVIRYNLVEGCYPVFSGGGQGSAALAYGAGKDAVFTGNVIVDCGGGQPANPIPGNFYSPNMNIGLPAGLRILDPASDPAKFVLTASSPYKGKAGNGKDPGADVPAILAAIKGVVRP